MADSLVGFRVLRLSVGYESNREVILHFAVPDDGRHLGDITLGELRPLPGVDADQMLERIARRAAEEE